ncbi:uncharacterized protein LOC144383550 [Gasterosteus aculeatus]
MENVEKDPKEEREPALLAQNQEPASTVSTQDIEEDPNTQTHETFNEAPSESQEEEEEKEAGEESEKHGGLMQWKKTVEECEANVRSQMWETVEKDRCDMTELTATSQAQKSNKQKMKAKKGTFQPPEPEVPPVELRRDLNRMEKRVGRHFALADARQHEELSGPSRPRGGAGRLHVVWRAAAWGQKTTDFSVGPRAESREATGEAEEGKISAVTLKKVLELLCDKAGFLVEDTLLKGLVSLEEEEQTVVKMASLLCTFGLEDKHVPKLALFILKYKPQQKAEGAETESATHLTSELIDPNHVMPALKVFLEQHSKSRGELSQPERNILRHFRG